MELLSLNIKLAMADIYRKLNIQVGLYGQE